ncbi:response regulator transcription factor [Ramlibacter alkalitolerans]|uniref:Response regulator transcription factor n=1 Tax=Ramlibacter alkalitolerans TaxID=2039631 RepID=A0ABS1JM99_9BURK|nr:response regulator transcription factor [Ramlibacter alkalitolerans]MBL0425365.1 response regulator transcription factor [Ramlibacter alkalitolerans]
MRILLVEDEPTLGTWLARVLERSGILVDWVDTAALALASLGSGSHDVVVLDLGLPDRDGQDLLADIRSRDSRIPALVLTARDTVDEKVRAFHGGADDFLAKPFALEELEARLHALLRRARGGAAARLACGPLAYDLATQRFTLGDAPLALSPREFAVLRVLLQHAGEPMSKQQVLERVVSDEKDIQPEAVEVIVHRLRKRLEGAGVRIATLRGLGYALEAA